MGRREGSREGGRAGRQFSSRASAPSRLICGERAGGRAVRPCGGSRIDWGRGSFGLAGQQSRTVGAGERASGGQALLAACGLARRGWVCVWRRCRERAAGGGCGRGRWAPRGLSAGASGGRGAVLPAAGREAGRPCGTRCSCPLLCCPCLRSPAPLCLSRQRDLGRLAAPRRPAVQSPPLGPIHPAATGVTSVRKHEPRFQTRRPDLCQDERLSPLAGQGKHPAGRSALLLLGTGAPLSPTRLPLPWLCVAGRVFRHLWRAMRLNGVAPPASSRAREGTLVLAGLEATSEPHCRTCALVCCCFTLVCKSLLL